MQKIGILQRRIFSFSILTPLRPFRRGQQHRQELWQQKAQKNASPSLVTLIADEISTLENSTKKECLREALKETFF